jgi:hypothetical protein
MSQEAPDRYPERGCRKRQGRDAEHGVLPEIPEHSRLTPPSLIDADVDNRDRERHQ